MQISAVHFANLDLINQLHKTQKWKGHVLQHAYVNMLQQASWLLGAYKVQLRDTTSVNLIPAFELSENVFVILSECNAFHL